MQMDFGPIPLRAALEAGVRPSVGADIVAVTRSDLPTQAKMLLQTQRAADHAEGRESMFNVADVLPYVDVNPAAALGLDDEVGTLTPGRRADVVLLNTREDLNLTASTDVAATLVLLAQPRNVHTVLVDGRVIKDGPVIPGHDLPALCQELQQRQSRLLAEAGLA
jgi:cytosine/adenosine deaminase-related metal-dependent hydrolase